MVNALNQVGNRYPARNAFRLGTKSQNPTSYNFIPKPYTMARLTISALLLTVIAQAVPEGFTIKDYVTTAQEPELYPTALSADPSGGIYISSDKNGSLGHIKGMGRILVARDTKGDGKVDSMTEFVKVESPRGGHFVGGVFYLIHPPYLTAYRDTKGTGLSLIHI